MQILNLKRISKYKRNAFIRDVVGGQLSRKERIAIGGNGVGGLKYQEGVDLIDQIQRNQILKSNFEVFLKGIGIYLYNEDENYLLLTPTEELGQIQFGKEKDLIQNHPSSLFKFLLGRNVPYHKAKIWLQDRHFLVEKSPLLSIETSSEGAISFEILKRNPLKVDEFFQRFPHPIQYQSDYQTFEYDTDI